MPAAEWLRPTKRFYSYDHVRSSLRIPSISAQLRHLKKPQFGSYLLEKRRRGKLKSGLWEYRLRKPEVVPERKMLFG